MPGLLIIGLVVLQRKFPDQVAHHPSLFVALGLLQVVALAALKRPQWRAQTLAICAVLALWSFYILQFEPVQRQLYDTRTFSREVLERVQKDPAPLVMHGMGKDAKAIKFMVNIKQDLHPVFTESPQELESLKGPAWLMMDLNVYKSLQGTAFGALPPVLSGRFDKNDFVLLHFVQ
jgi:hypothetical protein